MENKERPLPMDICERILDLDRVEKMSKFFAQYGTYRKAVKSFELQSKMKIKLWDKIHNLYPETAKGNWTASLDEKRVYQPKGETK